MGGQSVQRPSWVPICKKTIQTNLWGSAILQSQEKKKYFSKKMKLMQPIRPKVCNSLQSSLNTQEITGGFSQNRQSWQVIGCMKPPITPVIKAAPVLVFVPGKVTTSAAEMGFDSRGEVRFSSFHRQSVPTRLLPQTSRRKLLQILHLTIPESVPVMTRRHQSRRSRVEIRFDTKPGIKTTLINSTRLRGALSARLAHFTSFLFIE